MPKIKSIFAREILDSRGWPTIETHVELSSGAYGYAQVPSGASTGIHEAWELRDGGKRYAGRGVLKAVKNVNETIRRKLYGQDCSDIKKIDEIMIELDGTNNKKKLGANAILSVSMAVARAAADSDNLPLHSFIAKQFGFKTLSRWPRPMMNIINGGRHADNGLSIQEFMIVPKARDFSKMMRIGAEVYHSLHKLLLVKKLSTGLGDEGGFAPVLANTFKAFDLLVEAVNKSGYKLGRDVDLAIDAAASEFYHSGKYRFEQKKYSAEKLLEFYKVLIDKYPLISIEDGLEQDDWEGWEEMTKNLGREVLLVGDDLFVTNKERFLAGIEKNVANAILIKLNQIGTVSETIAVIKLAQANNYKVIISHRSGETGDDFIADLSVGCAADFIKSGAPARGERVAKYNRLLAISELNK